MVKCIGSEFYRKVGTSEEGSNRIREGSVSSLNRSILERGFSTSRANCITFGGEEVLDRWVVVEFAALVQVDILMLAVNSRGVLREEVSKPFNGRCFGSLCITILHTGEMICN